MRTDPNLETFRSTNARRTCAGVLCRQVLAVMLGATTLAGCAIPRGPGWPFSRASGGAEPSGLVNESPSEQRRDLTPPNISVPSGPWTTSVSDGPAHAATPSPAYVAGQPARTEATASPYSPDNGPRPSADDRSEKTFVAWMPPAEPLGANSPDRTWGTPESEVAPLPGSTNLGMFEPGQIVAWVGNEVILAGDVLGPINQALAPYADKMTKEQLDQQRELLMRQQVPVAAETKMLYLAYLRQAPAKADLDQVLPKIWEQIYKKFDEDELPKLLAKYEVDTPAELDAKFREFGWSLGKQRRLYGERNLGVAGAFQAVQKAGGPPEVTHEEMLRYYEEHAADFEVRARARWEKLTARFDKFPTREAAYAAIVQMGNEVVLGGAPLWAVAKRSSQGSNADQGGQFDWTYQGSLASEPLDEAIFSLPIGQLSPIIEDRQGFHIVRVLERQEAGRTPFTEAQVEIKKRLQEAKRQEAFRKYVEQLRREIPIRTIYDDPQEHSAASNSQ